MQIIRGTLNAAAEMKRFMKKSKTWATHLPLEMLNIQPGELGIRDQALEYDQHHLNAAAHRQSVRGHTFAFWPRAQSSEGARAAVESRAKDQSGEAWTDKRATTHTAKTRKNSKGNFNYKHRQHDRMRARENAKVDVAKVRETHRLRQEEEAMGAA